MGDVACSQSDTTEVDDDDALDDEAERVGRFPGGRCRRRSETRRITRSGRSARSSRASRRAGRRWSERAMWDGTEAEMQQTTTRKRTRIRRRKRVVVREGLVEREGAREGVGFGFEIGVD